jgi:hypothetical protein
VPEFKQKRLTIRHASNEQLVATVELVSPGNKASAHPLREFVKKMGRAVEQGINALVIDPLPPGRRDPNGIHGAIWPRLGGDGYAHPADKPLTVASYEAGDAGGSPHRCYVQPLAAGDPLPDIHSFWSRTSTSACRSSAPTRSRTTTCCPRTARNSQALEAE